MNRGIVKSVLITYVKIGGKNITMDSIRKNCDYNFKYISVSVSIFFLLRQVTSASILRKKG